MSNYKHEVEFTEQQQAFADTLSSPNIFTVIISEAELWEKNWNKDLLDFTKQEALIYLKSIHSLSLLSLMSYASTIRSYAAFVGKKETIWNNILQADLKQLIDVDELKNTYFKPEDVDKMEMILPNVVDRFILRGFYEGLYGHYYEEFKCLVMPDFDKEAKKVHLMTGKDKVFSDRLYQLAEESSRTYIYKAMDFHREQKRTLLDTPGYKGEIVKTGLKTSPGLEPWKRKIRGRMESVKEFFGLSYLTIPRLRNSRIYYELLQISKKNNCSIAEAVYLPEFEPIIYQFDLNINRKDKLAYKYKDMDWANEK